MAIPGPLHCIVNWCIPQFQPKVYQPQLSSLFWILENKNRKHNDKLGVLRRTIDQEQVLSLKIWQ